MADGLTRGERRGLIGLLAVLAAIIVMTALSGGVKAPPTHVVETFRDDSISIVYQKDMDTVNRTQGKRKKSRTKAKAVRPKAVNRQPERSPLDEPVNRP
ncbi:MAG: hypothetical protein K2J42_08300 [Muribaculaceae bacterium]|nr:hypothetical protein [Muribaculaceae bacterium]